MEHMSTLHFFNTHIWHLSRQQISQERLLLFQLINGDIFYPIRTWPRDIEQLFWKKPTGDEDTFKLLLFFYWQRLPSKHHSQMAPNISALGHTPKGWKEGTTDRLYKTKPYHQRPQLVLLRPPPPTMALLEWRQKRITIACKNQNY